MAEAEEKKKAIDKAKEYMEKAKIESLLADLLNTLVRDKPTKPIQYIIEYLSGYCTKEELEAIGYTKVGKSPIRHPVIKQPDFPQSSHSLLKKYLSPQLWKSLFKRKTKFNSRIIHCILPGLENPTLPIGLYASDLDAYTMFADLFNPIIKEIHSYDAVSNSNIVIGHVYDTTSVKPLPMSKYKANIKQLQMYVSRNYADYSFMPTLDMCSKYEILYRTSELFSKDLKSLVPNKISDEIKEKLLKEDMPIIPFPKVSEIDSKQKWSDGALVLYSEDYSQIVQINLEDHFKVMMSSKNGDTKLLFEQMFEKIKTIESKYPFAQSPNFGYLGTDPKNIGTCFRMRAVIEVPNVEIDLLSSIPTQAIINKHKVQLKKVDAHRFELKSTAVIGISEVDELIGFMECMDRILSEEDMAIQEKDKKKKELDDQKKKEEDLVNRCPKFEETNTTIIKNVLNIDIWKQLGDLKTRNGVTLSDCVKCGVHGEKIGIAALDSECYDKYGIVFKEIMKLLSITDIAYSVQDNLSECISKISSNHILKEGYLLWEFNFANLKYPPLISNSQELLEINNSIKANLAKVFENSKSKMLSETPLKSSPAYAYIANKASKIDQMKAIWAEDKVVFEEESQYILLNAVNHVTVIQLIKDQEVQQVLRPFIKKIHEITQTVADKISASPAIGLKNVFPADSGNGLNCEVIIHMPTLTEKGVNEKNILTMVNDKNITLKWNKKSSKISQEVDNLVSAISRLKEKEGAEAKSEVNGIINGMLDNVCEEKKEEKKEEKTEKDKQNKEIQDKDRQEKEKVEKDKMEKEKLEALEKEKHEKQEKMDKQDKQAMQDKQEPPKDKS